MREARMIKQCLRPVETSHGDYSQWRHTRTAPLCHGSVPGVERDDLVTGPEFDLGASGLDHHDVGSDSRWDLNHHPFTTFEEGTDTVGGDR
jgi:hypothetical protein